MRVRLFLIGSILGVLAPFAVHAATASITYSYEHHLFTLNPARFPEWRSNATEWLYKGLPATPRFCENDCDTAALPKDWTKRTSVTWNKDAIAKTIETEIGHAFDREPGKVTITQTSSGAVAFSGVGLTGRRIGTLSAAALTLIALEQNVSNVELPVTITQPELQIDESLKAMGIKEVVTIGESRFLGSTKNRKHNIAVGLAKFNGHIIKQDEIFSFGETLGPVDGRAGYLQELVIKGDRTVPDYGGGLCQVSSTAYRGVWEYGFPITQRKNHSYAVSYYFPQGTDATVYPPSVDIKFKNDSPGALLMQTHMDLATSSAYFVYYGTKDNRKSSVVGPYIWSTRAAPTERRIEYTTDIPPGTEKKLGERVNGASVSWFRILETGTGANIEETYSSYEARPLFYQVGVVGLPTASGATLEGADVVAN